MPGQRITHARIEKALRDAHGLVSLAARIIDCDPSTLRRRIAADERLQQLVEDQRDLVLDLAEHSLVAAVKRQEPWATKYLLSTLGKGRGYTQRQEVEHDGELRVLVEYVDDAQAATPAIPPRPAHRQE